MNCDPGELSQTTQKILLHISAFKLNSMGMVCKLGYLCIGEIVWMKDVNLIKLASKPMEQSIHANCTVFIPDTFLFVNYECIRREDNRLD